MDLVVDAEKKIPAICLNCGSKQHIVRRNERLTAATATQGLSAVGAVCGVMVARAMKDDPIAGAIVLGGALVGSVVVGWVIHSKAPKAELALPLCKDCNARWTAGVRIRQGILAILCVALVAIAEGFFAHDKTGYIVGGALIGVVLVIALAVRLPARFVHASAIQGSRVALANVSEVAKIAIGNRQAKERKSDA